MQRNPETSSMGEFSKLGLGKFAWKFAWTKYCSGRYQPAHGETIKTTGRGGGGLESIF